jgi:hypothetical protein
MLISAIFIHHVHAAVILWRGCPLGLSFTGGKDDGNLVIDSSA